MRIEVGVAFDTSYGPVEYAQQSLSEIADEPISIRRLPDLAGPNNVFQVIADPAGWVLLAKAVVVLYGAEFVKEAGKDGWRNRAKATKAITGTLTSPIRRLLTSLGWARYSRATPLLAIPVAKATRNVGIDVTGYSEEEIASLIVIMSRHAAAVQAHIDACLSSGDPVAIRFENNLDMSIKLVPNDDGSVSLTWSQWANSQHPEIEKQTVSFK